MHETYAFHSLTLPACELNDCSARQRGASHFTKNISSRNGTVSIEPCTTCTVATYNLPVGEKKVRVERVDMFIYYINVLMIFEGARLADSCFR